MKNHTKNSRKSFVSIIVLLALGIATVVGQTKHGYDRASLDPNTAACTDFYQYANGGWMAANPIPAAYPSWGVANVLDEKNKQQLHEILETAAKNTRAMKGSSEQKVGDYYATCMDEAKIEADGLKPLVPEFDRIAKIKDRKTLQ
ncbi:MAG TPA: M13 family metallopeptidase N-terminal domain-containing protein, partial [Pyrinomonadaceae bacterium]|nr:M13 family metallopeptidase N-terminal domain-containing protein [Pyrinomonadaceae bacterium]